MSLPPPQVWPTLRSSECLALIHFLVEVFGFERRFVIGDGDHVVHAQLAWPEGGGIMLGSAGRDDEDRWALEPGTFGAYVVTSDPASLHARVVAAGAEVIGDLRETEYGSLEFSCLDPEGNRWSFGTYRGEPEGS